MSGNKLGTSVVICVFVVGLSACTQTQDTSVNPSTSPSFASDYLTPKAVVYAPFTGVATDNPENLARPSFAAKIDNHPDARPQVGLAETDLLYEELVEGGMTRYVAVWHSQLPAEIGPIRSIRPMDPDIISPHGGIVAYSGGQQRFVDLMQRTEVYNAIHGQQDTNDFMYRTKDKRAPHDVIVRAPELLAMHADLGAPAQLYSFAESADSSTAAYQGEQVLGVDLVFGDISHPSWIWDETLGRWLRSQDSSADLDNLGEQLSAANMVVIRVGVSDDQGVPKTELSGSGEAVVFSAGRMLPATWSKPEQSAPIRLVDSTGNVIRLSPGNSWFELVPNSGSVTPILPPAE